MMICFKHKNLKSELRLMLEILRSFPVIFGLLSSVASGLCAQTFTDIGSSAPSPGTNDIAQLSTNGDQTWPDGNYINYFTDNNPPVGQTFTTGTNAMKLVSVALKTAGLYSGNGYGTPTNTPTYYLRIYSMSGSNATLLITFSAANPGFTDGDWLQWSGLNVPLGTNKTYAYSFGIQPTGGGYAALAVATNAYAGGEIAIIPTSGGTITNGSSHSFDAVFNLGLRAAATNLPATMPLPNPTYGWNLGNSLEAIWGYSYPSAAPFYTAANAGFNAVRIPCAWDSNATTNTTSSATNYPINPTYMAQVKQAVDYAIAAGMYVVINDHWDGGWLETNITTTVNPTINAKMNSYWIQIATAFAGYDNHLLFAAANEPNVGSPAEMVALMAYYQTFVNAVRGVGGNNTNRWLVLQGGGDTSWMNSLPMDSTPNRLMVEYHCYTPFQFTQMASDQSWGNMFYFWGPAYHYSGDPTRNATWGEEGDIDSGFQQLTDQYVSKGMPVMVGEFQAAGKSFIAATNTTEAAWNSASAIYWNKYVVDSAHAHGLSPFYWSTPSSPFDYTTGAVNGPDVVAVLTGGIAPPPPNGAPYAAPNLTATNTGNGQINLSWTAGSGATSFNLYRAAESGYESPMAPVVTGITNTSYTDTNLNSGTTYYYQVVAVNSSGPSGFSPEAHAMTPGVNPDPTQFNFETDSQRWYAIGSQIAGIATSTAQHFAGRQSLAVNFNGTNADTSSVSVGNVVVSAGSNITFRVWIPSGYKLTALQPYLVDYNGTWTTRWYGSLTANAWNTLTLTVPANAITPLQQLGVQFITSAAWTNTCYIDSVAWSTPLPSNTPPVLAAISNQTVNVGQTVAFTASATDTDSPPQTLTFSLLAGATGATLNTNSGAFSWTPPVGFGGTSNLFTISVADNGSPSLSATQSFYVTVNKQTPVLKAPVASAITYGQTLASSSLSGGAATNSANNASVAGSFAFTAPATAPGAGTANQSVTFTPSDTTNYNSATVNVNVTVYQASPTLAFSSSKTPSGYKERVIFTASLPADATGTVNFLTNGVLFDARTLGSGSATATNSTLPNGTNLITAIYSGNSNYLGRTNTLNQVVTNTPPVLAAITNRTVNVGQTVAFTASATDTDSPPQTLTFSLLAGATNATLAANSGAFSFRPLVTQANSTNSFTLKVSDNGVPSLSATQSFSVIVNPLSAPGISAISFAGGQFSFKVSGQSGPDYAIEISTNLKQWSNVFITNSPGLPFNWTDTNVAAPQRFYRVKPGPPWP
jgi:hypothetical protein